MTADLPPELSPRAAAVAPTARPGRLARAAGWLATGLAVVVLVTSVAGWGLLTYYDGKIQRIPGLSGLLSGGSTGPLNILIVGSDTRTGLTEAQRKALSVGGVGQDVGQRSDTTMLVHISADRQYVTVVSLPRDSYVKIPAYTDSAGHKHPAQHNKLNAAYALGGAPLLIRTVEQLTGLDVNHYIEVGFAGVVNTVDAIGGVDVCLPYAVNDQKSGLVLPAGRSHVGGVMGLAFVRARYIDPTADIGRMQRQQEFLAAMFKRATSLGVLLNPAKLNAFLNAALSSVTMDDSLSRDMLLGLATDLQNLKPKNLRFLTVPLSNVNAYRAPYGSVVMWDHKKAHALFSALGADQPLEKDTKGTKVAIAPSQVSVQVLNGSSVSGLATKASDALAALGFHIAASPTNADRTDVTTTVIQYDPQWSDSVKTLEATFPDAQVEQVPGMGGTFKVLVGTGYTDPVKVRVEKNQPKISSSSAADSLCG